MAEHLSRPLALVVDDEADNRAIIAAILLKQGFDVVEGVDGIDAVRLAEERAPSVILMDIMMPRMDGLQALREIRDRDPHVPVVIVSGAEEPHYSEEALSYGATNFIRKPFDKAEIRFVAERIRGALSEEADIRPALELLVERRTAFEIGNDLHKLSKVVAYLGRELRLQYPGFDVSPTEVKLALYEALANAVEHGNLEITYDEKTQALGTEGGITALIESRRSKAPYADRKVRIEASYGVDRVTYKIRDSGPGFRVREYEATHTLADTSALHGRGILLIKHYMRDVEWNPSGNEISMSLPVTLRRASDSGMHWRPEPRTPGTGGA